MRIRFWCFSTVLLSILLVVVGQIEFAYFVNAQEIPTSVPSPTADPTFTLTPTATRHLSFINEDELTLYPPSPTTTPTSTPRNLTPTLTPFPTMAVATPTPNSEPTLYMPPSVQALKITITEEGIYELTRDVLAGAGFAVDALDPAAIQLMHRGQQVTYQIINDDGDGRFSPNETIRFYGWAFDGSNYEQFFVKDTIYWLWFDETAAPRTMPIESNPAASSRSAVHTFPESLHFEENNFYKPLPLIERHFAPHEPNIWYWDWYPYQYNNRSSKTVDIAVDGSNKIEVYGSAAPHTKISFLLYEPSRFIVAEEVRWSNEMGRWGIVFDLGSLAVDYSTYALRIEAEGSIPVTIELADGRQVQTVFHPAETHRLNIPHPAQTSRVATFTAEFATGGQFDDKYRTEVLLGDGSKEVYWSESDYVGVDGYLTNDSLTHGENIVTVIGFNGWLEWGSLYHNNPSLDPGGSEANRNNPRVWFNGITVNYERELSAENDTLQFGHTELGQRNFYVRGLTEGDAAEAIVWDVSDRFAPTIVTLVQSDIELDGGAYRWRIGRSIMAGQPLEMFVTTASNIKSITPEQLDLFTPTAIDPAANGGAEWVAITHNNFYTSAVALADYRADMSNLSTHVVDIKQIINQYGFGYHLSHAIQDYMRHAYTTWQTPPRYLLLVGDADYNMYGRPCDTCNYWSTDDETFITADHQFMDRFIGRLTTDYTYALLDGYDPLPEIAVGRLPVQTAAELDTILNKMRIYEQAVTDSAEWVQNVLMIADNEDGAGNFCYSVEDTSWQITSNAPDHYNIAQYCMDTYIDDPSALTIDSTLAIETFPAESDLLNAAKEEVRTQMFNHVNDTGVGIINYRGHGVVDAWGGGVLNMRSSFENNHIAQWQNENPAVIISADCLDTSFARSGLPGLAETTLKLPQGGSVAHFGSTGVGFNRDHTRLIGEFYDGLLQDDDISTIGDAVKHAKEQYITTRYSYPYNLGTWDKAEMFSFTLLGDPALRLPVPPPSPTPTGNLFLPLISR